jgi:hypothetical protein
MKIKLTIPTKLSEITLKQYQQFLEIAKNNEDNNFLQQKVIQIFCGVDLKHVQDMHQKDINEISNRVLALFETKQKLITRFNLGGLEFGFIPNLDEITSGEYIDLDTYITDTKNMHRVMAILYRPIVNKQKDKYGIEPYISSITYSEVMEFMPLDVALSAMVFFWTLGIELVNSTATYLESNKAIQDLATQHNLGNVGVGIVQSMRLLKESCEDLMRSQSYHYINA